MIPCEKLTCISLNSTIGAAMDIIDKQNLLSLPVVDGKQFIGVLSKQHTYEYFFKEYDGTKEEYGTEQLKKLMHSKIETVRKDLRIEEAAAMFISSKVRFIPVVDEKGDLEGIITQQAVFREYQKLFGHKYNSLIIYTYDSKGTLAEIADTIAKAGGNIRNMLVMDVEIMGLVEIFLRIDAKDFDKVVKSLVKNKYDVRNVKYEV